MLGLASSMLFPLCRETTDFDVLCNTDVSLACALLQLFLVGNLG